VILNQVSYGIAVRMAVMAMAMSGQASEQAKQKAGDNA
jgi:aspartate carbamoyltransferase catalytic subunit